MHPAHATQPGRRLLVISNPAPVKIVRELGRERIESTVGGLGSIFLRLLERSGGLWIRWMQAAFVVMLRAGGWKQAGSRLIYGGSVVSN